MRTCKDQRIARESITNQCTSTVNTRTTDENESQLTSVPIPRIEAKEHHKTEFLSSLYHRTSRSFSSDYTFIIHNHVYHSGENLLYLRTNFHNSPTSNTGFD